MCSLCEHFREFNAMSSIEDSKQEEQLFIFIFFNFLPQTINHSRSILPDSSHCSKNK